MASREAVSGYIGRQCKDTTVVEGCWHGSFVPQRPWLVNTGMHDPSVSTWNRGPKLSGREEPTSLSRRASDIRDTNNTPALIRLTKVSGRSWIGLIHIIIALTHSLAHWTVFPINSARLDFNFVSAWIYILLTSAL